MWDGARIDVKNDAWRPDTLWLHRLGTPVTDDVKLFHEPDEKYWLGAGITRSLNFGAHDPEKPIALPGS